ncbi:hypothetical protein CAURIC_07210 [Corynebacterium auriscanis]|nr:hypothetical protein CAURIC_07210 [Corynebacterium auriscanis]
MGDGSQLAEGLRHPYLILADYLLFKGAARSSAFFLGGVGETSVVVCVWVKGFGNGIDRVGVGRNLMLGWGAIKY